MEQLEGSKTKITAALVGGTALSFITILVVLGVVSAVVGGLATLVNYYMSSMRIEAAGFFGALIGGWIGVLCSRFSCDAILKVYSKKSAFLFITIMVAIGFYVELIMLPLDWERVTPIAQLAVVEIAAFTFFWNDGHLDY